MKIILTNAFLSNHTGSEVYIRDLSIRLKQEGWEVFVYTLEKGLVSSEIEKHGIKVSSNIYDFPRPDIIHAQHNIVSRRILNKFSNVPAVFFLHNRIDATEKPVIHPSIKKYISVDYNCRDRYLERGISEDKIDVIYNWVDIHRFKQKKTIPDLPKSALVFSNYGGVDDHYKIIEEACKQEGIKLHGLGLQYGNATPCPENILCEYDLVFAKAKACMESVATGCGAIICDLKGLGHFVTPENYEHTRRFNFGMRTMIHPITVDGIRKEINQYNRDRVLEVSNRLRKEADFNYIFEKITNEYKKHIA